MKKFDLNIEKVLEDWEKFHQGFQTRPGNSSYPHQTFLWQLCIFSYFNVILEFKMLAFI